MLHVLAKVVYIRVRVFLSRVECKDAWARPNAAVRGPLSAGSSRDVFKCVHCVRRFCVPFVDVRDGIAYAGLRSRVRKYSDRCGRALHIDEDYCCCMLCRYCCPKNYFCYCMYIYSRGIECLSAWSAVILCFELSVSVIRCCVDLAQKAC